ncbi:intracellular protein transport protein USO1 [Reticulomyxa filosa]|uniref:Intracellular protein transport protein USO1 n=1 Tax=Reticulomyxa filosa TaxID=46433 RepID=X6MF75_RETFI|nr:intracellular protein transport protein USO1 [Reticulomyxa filosa]|eukprot:ETO12539.1 intracellular protein transport protein USO1 [Reticulomyxa filosa]
MTAIGDEERTYEIVLRWINLFALTSTPIQEPQELSDGVVVYQLMEIFSPKYFPSNAINLSPHSSSAKICNMKCLKSCFEQFFADTLKEKLSLQETIQPAALAFGKQPKVSKQTNSKKKKKQKKIVLFCFATDFISLIELLLLAAIKSEKKEKAISNMLQLDPVDQKFLMHVLDDLLRQNGFMESNNGNDNANSGNGFGGTCAKSPHWQSFAQLSARKYDKSRRLSMQSPFGTRSRKKPEPLLTQQQQQQQSVFDFDSSKHISSSVNKTPFAAAFSTNRNETTPFTNKNWSTSGFGALDGNKRESTTTTYELLQGDFDKLEGEYKQLLMQYSQLKEEHKCLQEKIRNDVAIDFQKKEKEYQAKMAMLEDNIQHLQDTSQEHLKEAKHYEELAKDLQVDNEKLNEELTQLATLHETQVRQYHEEIDAAKQEVNRLKSCESQWKQYQHGIDISNDQIKDLEKVKAKNNDLLNQITDLKFQLLQIPQLKEQVEKYKQQMMEYKVRSTSKHAIDANGVNVNADVNDRVTHLEKELLNATQEKEEMALKLRECRNDMSALRSQIIELKNYQRNFDRYKKDIGVGENENGRLKQAIEELEVQQCIANDAQSKYREAVREVSELKEQIKKLEWGAQGGQVQGRGSPPQSKAEWNKKISELNDLQMQMLQRNQFVEKLKKQMEELKQENMLLQEKDRNMNMKCQDLQKQVDAITQYSSEQKKRLKEYHAALEQLHHQKIYGGNNDCQAHKETIENLKVQIQQLKEEKKMNFESHRHELLSVSNAFHCLALQRTLEAHNLTWFSQQNNNIDNDAEMLNGVPTKGKENTNEFNQSKSRLEQIHKIIS